MTRLLDNLAEVRERIAAAAIRSGRTSDAVTLVAVTKYVEVPLIRELMAAGCLDLGEARPQALWNKAAELADSTGTIRWHMIGHLQRNKVERTLPLTSLIHSADSVRLISEIDAVAQRLNRVADVLLEVNISQDDTKHGFQPEQLLTSLDQLAGFPNIAIRGLMAMASREGDERQTREEFIRLRELRDQAQSNLGDQAILKQLSIGMSGDFEIAIEEGATIVRIGSQLFEGIDT
ncbi:MAG: YggS family pyridoxal phosphate-dependent enzyme [Planctomycetota bacterium]|nr:YggS family pyridoxal phosphate-dependent enzyme [Planctomycetota bacterium]